MADGGEESWNATPGWRQEARIREVENRTTLVRSADPDIHRRVAVHPRPIARMIIAVITERATGTYTSRSRSSTTFLGWSADRFSTVTVNSAYTTTLHGVYSARLSFTVPRPRRRQVS